MNKKMRELLNKIAQKRMMAKGFMEDGENKDLEKAKALMDEADELQKEYDYKARFVQKPCSYAVQCLYQPPSLGLCNR